MESELDMVIVLNNAEATVALKDSEYKRGWNDMAKRSIEIMRIKKLEFHPAELKVDTAYRAGNNDAINELIAAITLEMKKGDK